MATPTPLDKERLAGMAHQCCDTCGDNNHDDTYFQSRCHPRAPTWTFYRKSTGLLTVECAVCRKMICEIKVAT